MNRNIKIAVITEILNTGTLFASSIEASNEIEFLKFIKSQNINIIEKSSTENIRNELNKTGINLEKIDLKQMMETAIQENNPNFVAKIFALAKALGNIDILFKQASTLPEALKTQNVYIINKTLNEKKSTSILNKAVKTQNLKIIDQVLRAAKQTSEYKNLFITKNRESVIKTAIQTKNPDILNRILDVISHANSSSYINIFKEHNRNSLLAVAILTNNEKIIDIVLSTAKMTSTYADLFIAVNSHQSVLAVAVETKNPHIVKKILDATKYLKDDGRKKEILKTLFGTGTCFSIIKYAEIFGSPEIVDILRNFESEMEENSSLFNQN